MQVISESRGDYGRRRVVVRGRRYEGSGVRCKIRRWIARVTRIARVVMYIRADNGWRYFGDRSDSRYDRCVRNNRRVCDDWGMSYNWCHCRHNCWRMMNESGSDRKMIDGVVVVGRVSVSKWEGSFGLCAILGVTGSECVSDEQPADNLSQLIIN